MKRAVAWLVLLGALAGGLWWYWPTALFGQAPATQRVYRWTNAEGVNQLSDRPPPSGAYETLDIPLGRNVVPLRERPADEIGH